VRRLVAASLAAPLASLLLAGCSADPTLGYSAASTYAANVSTVAVPVFGNDTFDYHAETMLTEAIIKEIQQNTPWRVVDAGAADTTINGTIVSSDIRKTATRRGVGYAQEQAIILTVDFEWKDNRTGQILVTRRGFAAAEVFAPSLPVQERRETGEHATIQELARDIVSELRSNW
jgi:hypothetical protein